MKNSFLQPLGWNSFFEAQLERVTIPGFQVGRVTAENKTNYGVRTIDNEYVAEITGKLMFAATAESDLPKVGDWVVITIMDEGRAMIHEIFSRQSILSRKAVGKQMSEQVIACNLDVLFIVQGLDDNFNLARLERYVTAARGIEPVVVLNKADVCPDVTVKIQMVKDRLPGIGVIAVSALAGDASALAGRLSAGRTFAFVGSSGVGKSSLINLLMNKGQLKTTAVRAKDSKGRHTTTRREMIFLDNGAILVDTPGMREFQPWTDETGLGSAAFADIEALAPSCRFSDCQHMHEAGCAVKLAVTDGSISAGHYDNYLRLKREMDYLESRVDGARARQRKSAEKKMIKAYKKMVKGRKG